MLVFYMGLALRGEIWDSLAGDDKFIEDVQRVFLEIGSWEHQQ